MTASKTWRWWGLGAAVALALATAILWSPARPAHAQDRTSHERALRELVLSRAADVPRALGKIRHTTYEDDSPLIGDVLENEAPFVAIGKDAQGRIVGLTTQCGVSFRFPDYAHWDPQETGAPEFELSLAELSVSGLKPLQFLVESETDGKAAELKTWHQGYHDFFAKAMPSTGSVSELPEIFQGAAGDVDRLRRFHELRRSRAVLGVEPLGNHDLALVTLPASTDLPTLGLENPREKVIRMVQDVPFSKLLGRELLLRCENCTARMENRRARPTLALSTASLVKAACFLVARDCVPFVAGAIDLVPTMLTMASEARTGLEAAGRIEQQAKLGQLGLVLDFTEATLAIRSGHLIEAGGRRYRLAHVHGTKESAREVLEKIVHDARASGFHVLGIVEAESFDGERIAHFVIPETKTYVNLKLVQEGAAQAFAHREPLRTAGLFELMRLQERLVLK